MSKINQMESLANWLTLSKVYRLGARGNSMRVLATLNHPSERGCTPSTCLMEPFMESPSASPHLQHPKGSFFHLVWAGLFMLTGLCILIYLGNDRQKVVGQPVFDLDIKPLAHTETSFDLKVARGKLALLHFWGPWCAPCRVEYSEIEKLASKYSDAKQVCIVSISCAATAPDDVMKLKEDTLAFLSGTTATHPVYCDPVEYSRVRIAKLLGQRGFSYPTSILLDSQGQIVDYWIRPTYPGELDKSIQAALSKAGKKSK